MVGAEDSESRDNSDSILEKLRRIPKNELCVLIHNHFYDNPQELREIIYSITQQKSRNPLKKIENFKFDQLIQIIIEIDPLPEDIINQLFNEYGWGKTYNLFLYKFYYPQELNEEETISHIKKVFIKMNSDMEKKESSFRNFKFRKCELDLDTYEIEYSCEHRIDFIDPESEAPTHTFGFWKGLIWMSYTYNYLIFQVDDNSIVGYLKESMKDIIGCKLEGKNLSKEIVNRIFPPESMIKASYVDHNPGDVHVNSVIMMDPTMHQKADAIDAERRCERRTSFHNLEDLPEFDFPVNIRIDQRHSKISITTRIRKTDALELSTHIIAKLDEEQSKLKTDDLYGYANSIPLENIQEGLKGLHGDKMKKDFVRLSSVLYDMIENESKSVFLPFNITSSKMRKLGLLVFSPSCPICSGTLYKCKSCQTINSIILNRDKTLQCSECGAIKEKVQDSAICSENHALLEGINENVFMLLNLDAKKIIRNISASIKLNLPDLKDFTIHLSGDMATLFTNKNDSEIKYQNIDSFKGISTYEEKDYSTYERATNEIGEKCKQYGKKSCRNCKINDDEICLQKLAVAHSTYGQLRSHSPIEYGDFTFEGTINRNTIKYQGLAKAVKTNYKPGITLANNHGLLAQILRGMNTSTVRNIMIISNGHIDYELRDMTLDLAKKYSKKVTFIDSPEIPKIILSYNIMKGVKKLD